MGKLIDRDYLWRPAGMPQTLLTWRSWMPLGLIPIAAAFAWTLTAPDSKPTSKPAAAPAIQSIRPLSRDNPLAHAAQVHFVPLGTGSLKPYPASLKTLAFSPARSMIHLPVSGPGWQSVTIRAGDTLSLAFARHGLSYMDSLRIAHLPKLGRYITRGLQAGDVLQVKADQAGHVQQLIDNIDPLHQLSVVRGDNGLTGSLAERRPKRRPIYASGVIHSSLYYDALRDGLTERQAARLRHIFARAVDLNRKIQPGDRFAVIYNELDYHHKKLGDGPILAAALLNDGHMLRALRRTSGNGQSNYYRPDGRPMRAAFVRAPVAYTRISSPFNLHRRHPILHRVRRHVGTDYAAPSGTPIHATGSGRIIFQGRRGSYGKTVIIRHNRDITMRFAHMSRFTHELHIGSRVKQGQTIGYVGMTGLATGPHVHYEFRIDGKPRNPQTVTLPGAPPLTGRQLAAFKARHADLLARLNDMTDDAVHVASAADSP